ncbi:EcoKI restriction-modification system protein HsdS [Acinetobacter venetianus]|uniref:EcoKI restriction-modification system protein HsdS n=1 Tax=Acinetobacter venetianus TaxID=52133 RepID=A0A150I171_9GAMM|nr:restriction endonuclease subunit S [Acinetobacter venetianus]KXZ73307.1 EcoKI restriction-modification system protein HsdS [Acinetobacter venetianus]
MAKYQKYSEYKESGVEWLGDIPSHWTATVLKRYARITDGSHHSPKIESEGFPFVSVTDVGINNINFVDAKKIAESDYSRLVKEGCKPAVNDVLLTKDGTIGRACIVTAEMPDFVILSSLGLITPSKAVSSQFLYYYLVSGINVDQMNSVIHGSALKRMTINKINDLIFTFPIFYEQEKIANFLDHETAQIDTLIAKQVKLIELLKEKRQAVISHAVTKGLNPNVAMKDSGVEWLGKVPEHWKVVKLSYKLKLLSGDGITAFDIEDTGTYPVFGGNGLRGFTEKYNCDGEYALIGRQGALCGNINVARGQFFATEHAVVVYPYEKFNLTFLSEFLRFMDLGQYSVSAAQPGIAVDRINTLPIVIPTLDEQNAIGAFLDQETAKIDTLISKAKTAIQLMQERRTAVISAAVTGKIDVRNWQNPNQKNEADVELSA